MVNQLICQDCRGEFEWHTICKELCPSCVRKHRLLTQLKYNHSEKGIALQQKREARRRRLWKWHDPERQHQCKSCGIKISRRAEYCRPCCFEARKEKRRSEHHGNVVSQGDYLYVYLPEHPRADKKGYVRQHMLIWEQMTGKELPLGWHVHHLNGIKKDNRPSNLVGLPSKKHYLVLKAKAKRIQELEALLNNQHQLI